MNTCKSQQHITLICNIANLLWKHLWQVFFSTYNVICAIKIIISELYGTFNTKNNMKGGLSLLTNGTSAFVTDVRTF